MFRMVVGHSDDVDADRAVESVLEQCKEALVGELPKAGLLFSTYDADPEVLVSGVRTIYPDLELVGSSSAGEMSSVLGFREDSITLALFVSDTVDITAGLGESLSADPQAAIRASADEARSKTDKEPRLCITMPARKGFDGAELVRDLQMELGEGVALLGGGSASREVGSMESHQFYNDRVVRDSLPLLLFSGPLSYSVGVDTGWRPVGPKGKVGRSDMDAIYEIDGKPALEFYERYLGAGAKPSRANPLAVFEDDSDDFYLRVPVFHDPSTGAVRVGGAIPENATVQLTVAVTDEILEGTKSAVQKAMKGYPVDQKPGAALVFSCAIRKLVLGTRTGQEIDITREELGDAIPVCGFYSFGEIAPIESGTPRLHNETMVAVLLGTE